MLCLQWSLADDYLGGNGSVCLWRSSQLDDTGELIVCKLGSEVWCTGGLMFYGKGRSCYAHITGNDRLVHIRI